MDDKNSTLICLDLEGTLISNAVSQIPRSHLFHFLTEIHKLARLVLFTSVSPKRTIDIQHLLVHEGKVPDWFGELEALHPAQTVKPMSQAVEYAPLAKRYLLVDDQPRCIEDEHRAWWIKVSEFIPPYENDDELLHVLCTLRHECQRGD